MKGTGNVFYWLGLGISALLVFGWFNGQTPVTAPTWNWFLLLCMFGCAGLGHFEDKRLQKRKDKKAEKLKEKLQQVDAQLLETEALKFTKEQQKGIHFDFKKSDEQVLNDLHDVMAELETMPITKKYANEQFFNDILGGVREDALDYLEEPRKMAFITLGKLPVANHVLGDDTVALTGDDRREHMHILASSGSGKTQTIQAMLVQDYENNIPFIVVDSQMQMIPKIMQRMDCVLIDPESCNLAMNLFDIKTHSEAEHNTVVSLLEYVFRSLLGVELTGRQSAIFGFLIKACMACENPTINTLRDIIKNPSIIDPKKLDQATEEFFTDIQYGFFSKRFDAVRGQLIDRLNAVMRNTTLHKMLSAPMNKIDMHKLMGEGKCILINTAKDYLGDEGSAIFGRFMIALIRFAVYKRMKQNLSFYAIYLDEAHEYFDGTIETMLSQSRKANVGWHLAHQYLSQADESKIKDSLMTNTAIKLIGDISAKDSRALSAEIGQEPEFGKSKKAANWTLYIKNKGVFQVPIAFGQLEALKVTDDYQERMKENKERVCYTYVPKVVKDDKPQQKQQHTLDDGWGA